MNNKVKVFLASALVYGSGVVADTYQVSTSLLKNGELVASPVMVVEAGKMALVAVGSDFSYNLTLKPNLDQTANIIAAVTMGEDTIQPEFTVAYGKQATVQVGEQKLTLLVHKTGG